MRVDLKIAGRFVNASAFNINWDDGSPEHRITATVATHVYEEPGEYTIRVSPVVSGVRLDAVLAPTITVAGSGYAFSVSVWPTLGVTPLDVTLVVTEVNGHADSFTVDWDDGSPIQTGVTAAGAEHRYQAPGTFAPVVTAMHGANASPPYTANAVVVSPATPAQMTVSVARLRAAIA
ncbi:hypothetical protein [Paraburkholderia adhaesiva]|uniref:hypothetical protein n=1 Tax=Paraburkholderia adhaesiva TaxID=2883244 RepID=UPI001F209E7D|nr:hypothetical protein [Paraburkholderia adhaesiva]